MSIYEKILSRRTIRKFQQKQIGLSTLKKLVNAGRLAPSAANLQPLEYYITNEVSLREKIFSILNWAGYIKPEGNPKEGEKPVAYIIILMNTKISSGLNHKYDVGDSAQNIILASQEEKIGCCLLGAFSKKKNLQVF